MRPGSETRLVAVEGGTVVAATDRVDELSGRSPEEIFREGEDLLARGEYAAAERRFALYVQLEPKSARGYSKMGVAQAHQGRLDDAELSFRRALELDPSMPAAYTNLGNVFFSRKEYEKAIECYRKALSLDPEYAIAHNNLAAAYKALGQIGKAVESLKRAHRLEIHARIRPSERERQQAREAVRKSCLPWAAVPLLIALVVLTKWLLF